MHRSILAAALIAAFAAPSRAQTAAAPQALEVPADGSVDPSRAAGFARAAAKQYWVQERIYRLADLYQLRIDGKTAVSLDVRCAGERYRPAFFHTIADLEFVGGGIGRGAYLGEGGERALQEAVAADVVPLERFEERGCMRYLRESDGWEWTRVLQQLDDYAAAGRRR